MSTTQWLLIGLGWAVMIVLTGKFIQVCLNYGKEWDDMDNEDKTISCICCIAWPLFWVLCIGIITCLVIAAVFKKVIFNDWSKVGQERRAKRGLTKTAKELSADVEN